MNLLAVSVNIVIGITSAIIATWMYEHLKARRERKPLNDILNFGRNEELVFVCPARTDVMLLPQSEQYFPLRILPWCTTEDFLAINNIKSALLKIHWMGKDSIKQPNTLVEDDKKKNIFCICSSKSNNFTKEIEDKISSNNLNYYRVRESLQHGKYEIWNGTSITQSPTYSQIDEYTANDPEVNLSECLLIDYAYITKINNPFNDKPLKNELETKIFIIAGSRGIGTWGAGECLKKEWKQIFNQLPSSLGKDSNFSALIKITYQGLDIKGIKVVNVITLDKIPAIIGN